MFCLNCQILSSVLKMSIFSMVDFFKFNNSGTVFCVVNASAYKSKMLLADFAYTCQIFLEIFSEDKQATQKHLYCMY